MVTDDTLDVLFVVAPYTADMKVPRAFSMRLTPAGLEILNTHIDSGDLRAYRVTCPSGLVEYFSAAASRSPYGFIQLKPSHG